MIHDKFCYTENCVCYFIAAIREDEREQMAVQLQAKACENRDCGHTACVVYFNAGRVLKGVAV